MPRFDRIDLYKGASDLDMLSTHFVARDYLEGLTKLPRMQEIPDHAFLVNPSKQVFVSHAWRAPNVPNDDTLEKIRALVANESRVGFWIDYCCLPQKRHDGIDDRTTSEKDFFKMQLQYIPTILAKSQVVVLWNERHMDRAWCVIEFILTDIFKNVVLKQVYHSQKNILDPVVLAVQTYNPTKLLIPGGFEGTPLSKILVPYQIREAPQIFYNSVLHQMGLAPTPLTTLLRRVEREHVDQFFETAALKCSNVHDIELLKMLLLRVCKFAGGYDVTTIKWNGKIPYDQLLPYILSNLSDFTTGLVDYQFS